MKVLFIEGEARFSRFDTNLNVSVVGYVFSGWRRIWSIINIDKFDLVVSTLAHNSYINAIISRASKRDVPTVLLVDGIFEWNNSFNNTYLNKIGVNLYRPNIHDYIYIVADEVTRSFIQHGGGEVCSILNERVWDGSMKIEQVFSKVLVTTSNRPCFNDAEYVALAGILNSLIEGLKLKSIDFGLRIFDERLLNLIDSGEEFNDVLGSFEDVLLDFSHVITTPSSIVLDAMSKGVAVCQLIYRDTPLPFQSGWIFGGVGQDNFLNSFLGCQAERYRFQFDVCKAHEGMAINKRFEELLDRSTEPETIEDSILIKCKKILFDFSKLLFVEIFNDNILVKKIKKHLKN